MSGSKVSVGAILMQSRCFKLISVRFRLKCLLDYINSYPFVLFFYDPKCDLRLLWARSKLCDSYIILHALGFEMSTLLSGGADISFYLKDGYLVVCKSFMVLLRLLD